MSIVLVWKGLGTGGFHASWKGSLGEAVAARFGVQMAKWLGYLRVELECDALNVMKAIRTKTTGRSPWDMVIEDVVHMS
ncbi:Carbon monoxide dehydrogenase/acetyl-CoA synthase subunit alpha, partial [Bienertia sinuspersici]